MNPAFLVTSFKGNINITANEAFGLELMKLLAENESRLTNDKQPIPPSLYSFRTKLGQQVDNVTDYWNRLENPEPENDKIRATEATAA